MVIENDAGDAALPTSTELAQDRTLLAHDRTLIYPEAGFSLATIMAAFISLLGILALIAVILRR
jgi:hypothetical protein